MTEERELLQVMVAWPHSCALIKAWINSQDARDAHERQAVSSQNPRNTKSAHQLMQTTEADKLMRGPEGTFLSDRSCWCVCRTGWTTQRRWIRSRWPGTGRSSRRCPPPGPRIDISGLGVLRELVR